MIKINYKEISVKLNDLEVLTIVGCAPRPGTDFIHSLFDSHPEILTIDGSLIFSDFFDNATSVFGTYNLMFGGYGAVQNKVNKHINLNHFFSEFAWKNLHKFDSSYDNLEKMSELGKLKNQNNKVSIDEFINHAAKICELLGSFSSRNALLSVYGAYALTRGDDILRKKVLLHQVHKPEYVAPLSKDFKNIKIIACIRDPRVYISKTIDHQRKLPLSLSKTHIGTVNVFMRLVVNGIELLKHDKNIEIRTNILEKLHKNPRSTMMEAASWINVKFDESMMKSTWSGKDWYGDDLSDEKYSPFDEGRYAEALIRWRKETFFYEKVVVEFMMKREMNHYGYEIHFGNILWFLPALIFNFFPTKYEISMFLKIFSSGRMGLFYFLFRSIILRYFLFYKKIIGSFVNRSYLVKNLN